MGSMIVVLSVFILFVHWKPTHRDSIRNQQIDFGSEQVATLELPPSTTHRVIETAPSRPVTPVPVPVDEILVDPIELPDAELNLDEVLDLSQSSSSGEGERMLVSEPQQPARISHIVEPSQSIVPEPYRGRVVVDVRLLIGPDGLVEQASIVRLTSSGEEQSANETESWLDLVLDAAYQWRFRPAVDQGRAVWSETVIQFHL